MKDLTQAEKDLASPQNTAVNDYLASLSRYVSRLDNPHEWLAQHKVSEISLRKWRDRPEHELIVANVAFPVSAKDGHNDKLPVGIEYRLERTVTDGKSANKPAPPTKADTGKSAGKRSKKRQKKPTSANLMENGSLLDSVSSASATSSDYSSSSIPGYKREANDNISGILARDTMLNEKDVAVLGLFRPANMSILHFAVLAKLIHSKSTEYTLFKENCYWYAFHVYATAFLENETHDDDDLTAALSALDGVNAAGKGTCAVVTEETVRDASAPQSSGTTRAAKRLSREAGRFMGFKLSKEDATKFREDYRQAIREEIEIVNAPGRTRRMEAEIERLQAQVLAMEELRPREVEPACA